MYYVVSTPAWTLCKELYKSQILKFVDRVFKVCEMAHCDILFVIYYISRVCVQVITCKYML